MKIRKSFLYLILAALMLGGCEKEEVQESGYQIYYTDEEGERLQSQTYIPEKEDTDELVDQMKMCIRDRPLDIDGICTAFRICSLYCNVVFYRKRKSNGIVSCSAKVYSVRRCDRRIYYNHSN